MDNGIFAGLKVLDCASFIAAPAAATVLSDFGAEVIKIEPPGIGRSLSQPAEPAGLSQERAQLRVDDGGRNKRSLALDLAKPEAARCCTGWSPRPTSSSPISRRRCAQRLSIAYDELAPLNERLIYASLHRLRRQGRGSRQARLRQQRLWARSGMMDLVRADERHDAGAFGRRHGRPSLRHGAVWRHRHRALQARAHRQGLARCRSNLMANGVWAAGVLAQAKLCGATFEQAAAARAGAQRRHQSLQVPRRPLDHAVAAQRGAAVAGADQMPRPRGPDRRSALRHQSRSPCPLARTDRDFRRGVCRQGSRANGARFSTATAWCSASSAFSTTFRTTGR